MSDKVDRILEILDVGEQYTTPEHQGFGDNLDWNLLAEIVARFLEALMEAITRIADAFAKVDWTAIEVRVRDE